MRYLIIFICFLSFVSCSHDYSSDFVVIAYKQNDHANNIEIEEGDTINLKTDEIVLAKGEELLLNNIVKGSVYNLIGPLVVSSNSISNSNVKSFNEKYVALIKENLNSTNAEIRHSVLGGVYRGGKVRLNVREGELLLEDRYKFKMLNVKDAKSDFAFFFDQELLSGCDEAASCSFNLNDLRDDKEDYQFEVAAKVETKKITTSVIIASREKCLRLLQEEKELIKEGLPDIVLINFYLSNKLFTKADLLLKKSKANSKVVDRFRKILE